MRLTVTKILTLLAVLAAIASGQTQVDLRTQSKSIDFSAAPSTKPFASGAALPATCGVGQMFFVTTATSGANVYGCSAVNTWTLQGGGSTSPTTVEDAGTVIGTRGILNLSAGPGILWSISDTGTAILAQTMLDTSLAQTRADDQSGANLFCASTSTAAPGLAYSCAMNPTLNSYATGMILHWIPDVGAIGGVTTTINIDTLGAIPVKDSDGVTSPASSDILAGQIYQVWYDGAVFRLLNGTGSGASALSAARIASGTAALATSPVASGSCAAAVTVTASGVMTTDNIQADFSADPTAITGYAPASGGILTIVRYPTAGAVNFKVCNNTAASVTPGLVTLNWRVAR
jgi:hypothetical protein